MRGGGIEMDATPRVLRPNRAQLELRPTDLESLLPEDHRARAVWEFVEGLDLSPLYERIRSVEGHAGRPAIDPAILMGLWLYATVEGVGSARALARLCEQHDAYRWICGGVSVNAHTLSDFRVAHEKVLDELLTKSVARLMDAGLVTLRRVAQDGMRVRASAGAASFRRRKRLGELEQEARQQVEQLRRELDDDPAATSRRQTQARLRAAKDRQARVKRALAEMPAVEAKKEADEKEEARVSTTDPEARVMRMADGGYRPAYNVQLATDPVSQVIVGVEVTNEGSDQGQLEPMLDQLEARYETTPGAALVDGGFIKLEVIERVTARGCRVYGPVPTPRDPDRNPHRPLPKDAPAVAAWRERMGREAAKRIYKLRAATAECVNAIARNRGLRQLCVRGRRKVRTVLLWFVLAHDMMRELALREAAREAA
jgi:transposase